MPTLPTAHEFNAVPQLTAYPGPYFTAISNELVLSFPPSCYATVHPLDEQSPYKPQHQNRPNNHTAQLKHGNFISTRRHASQALRRALQIGGHRGEGV